MNDHRTPEWMAEFERGKRDALAQAPGRAANIDIRRKQRDELVALMKKADADEGEFPTDPYNHGRRVMFAEIYEMHVM